MDDPALIEAFQAGDETAFSELVSRYRRQVYRVARSVLRNHEKADEATQDAFLKAYQGLLRFEGKSTFKTWMYRIATNAALDLRSREATQEKTRREARQEGLAAEPRAALGPRPLEHLLRSEKIERVRAAIGRLPDRQRLTMTLRVHSGLKFQEIAEAMGCPVGTAKANYHHAVKNLKKGLLARGESPTEDEQAVARER